MLRHSAGRSARFGPAIPSTRLDFAVIAARRSSRQFAAEPRAKNLRLARRTKIKPNVDHVVRRLQPVIFVSKCAVSSIIQPIADRAEFFMKRGAVEMQYHAFHRRCLIRSQGLENRPGLSCRTIERGKSAGARAAAEVILLANPDGSGRGNASFGDARMT